MTGTGAMPVPFQFLAAWVGVWVARHQTDQIEYLKAVNRALMERVGSSIDTDKNVAPRARAWRARRSMLGSSFRQGPHQLAHR